MAIKEDEGVRHILFSLLYLLRYDMDMKRRFLSIIFCLGIGAVINVGVAWTLAATVGTEGLDDWQGLGWRACDLDSPYRGLVTMSKVGLGSSRVVTEVFTRDFLGTPFPPVSAKPEEIVPDWAAALHQFPLDFDPKEANTKIRIHDARGWPYLSLWSSYDANSNSIKQDWIRETTHGISIDSLNDVSNREIGNQRLLPLRPIWSGFIINTLFYGVIVWLVVLGPFVLRRFIRARRKLCRKCAYPIGTSMVCTECGDAV